MRDSVLIMQRDSLLSQLFGDGSRLVASGEGVDVVVVGGVVRPFGFEIMVVVATLLYLYWLGRYVTIHHANRYRESKRKGIGGLEGSSSFLFDTTLPWGLFVSLATIVTLKLCELCLFESILSIPFGWLMGSVVVGFTLYWLWGWGVMRVWRNDDLDEKIVSLKVRVVLRSTIYILPIALLSSFVPTHHLLSYLLLAASLIVTIYYFVKTFLLFISEKFSSLRWFLYLCTVEVAPIVLLLCIFDYLKKLIEYR